MLVSRCNESAIWVIYWSLQIMFHMLHFRYIHNHIKSDELVYILSFHTCKCLQNGGFILIYLGIVVKLTVFQFHSKLNGYQAWKGNTGHSEDEILLWLWLLQPFLLNKYTLTHDAYCLTIAQLISKLHTSVRYTTIYTFIHFASVLASLLLYSFEFTKSLM